jgi:hypothetical protein
VQNAWPDPLKDSPPFFDEELEEDLVRTLCVFEGFLHLCDAALDELNARGITYSDQGSSPRENSVIAF